MDSDSLQSIIHAVSRSTLKTQIFNHVIVINDQDMIDYIDGWLHKSIIIIHNYFLNTFPMLDNKGML
jgi:hypothetical protein